MASLVLDRDERVREIEGVPLKDSVMILKIELEQESDGRWIAEVSDLPGVLAYGSTAAEARARVQVLALRVVADRLEHGEEDPNFPASMSFAAA